MIRTRLSRLPGPARLAAASGAAAALFALTACGGGDPAASPAPTPEETPAASSASPSASESASPSPKPVKASDNLDAISVSGERGKEPKVSFKAPWAIDKTRTKVLDEGDGATVAEGGTVEVDYYGVNGRTAKKFDDSFSRGETAKFPLTQVVPGFQKGLAGQKVGSRVLIAMPGEDGYDSSGGSPQAGIQVGDTLVFVVDIKSTTLTGPEGKEQSVPSGLPKVSTGEKPSVEIPKGDPPSKLEKTTVIQGTGDKVAETDAVTVRYQATSWKSGKVVDSNYDAKEPETGALSQLIPGWQEGLVGQTVGSRVLLVVPPDQAYPEGNESPKIEPGETLVYVVDILYNLPAQ